MHVETEEVDQLACAVDLRLVCVFALAQHGGGIGMRAVFGGEQFGGFEEHGGTLFPGRVRPLLACRERCVDGVFYMTGVSRVEMAKLVLDLVRGADVYRFTGAHFLAANVHGYVQLNGFERGQLLFEGCSFRGAGRIAQYRFIAWCCKVKISIVHGFDFVVSV